MSVFPPLSIAPIFVASRESKSIQIPISLTDETAKPLKPKLLLTAELLDVLLMLPWLLV